MKVFQPGDKIDCPLACDAPVVMTSIPRPRHAWGDVIVCPNKECDQEGGRCFLVEKSYASNAKLRIIAQPCLGKDLKPGDLFSTVGQDYWDQIDRDYAVGERVYIRTNNPHGADGVTEVFRITIQREGVETMCWIEAAADAVINQFEVTCMGHMGPRHENPNTVRGVTVGKLRKVIEEAISRLVGA